MGSQVFKWNHQGKAYCLLVQKDPEPLDPRSDTDAVTTIACWHRRHRLGDRQKVRDPVAFWRNLVKKDVSVQEIFCAVQAGRLSGIRVAPHGEDPALYDVYESITFQEPSKGANTREFLEHEALAPDRVVAKLMKDLTIDHCMVLMAPYAEWMPLWLCDHEKLQLAAGSRNPFSMHWDARCIGWIVMRKEHMRNKDALAGDWRQEAIRQINLEASRYAMYLAGEVYGYRLYGAADGQETFPWEELDSNWGFLGSSLLKNGMLERIGFGFYEAICSGSVEMGAYAQCQMPGDNG